MEQSSCIGMLGEQQDESSSVDIVGAGVQETQHRVINGVLCSDC